MADFSPSGKAKSGLKPNAFKDWAEFLNTNGVASASPGLAWQRLPWENATKALNHNVVLSYAGTNDSSVIHSPQPEQDGTPLEFAGSPMRFPG